MRSLCSVVECTKQTKVKMRNKHRFSLWNYSNKLNEKRMSSHCLFVCLFEIVNWCAFSTRYRRFPWMGVCVCATVKYSAQLDGLEQHVASQETNSEAHRSKLYYFNHRNKKPSKFLRKAFKMPTNFKAYPGFKVEKRGEKWWNFVKRKIKTNTKFMGLRLATVCVLILIDSRNRHLRIENSTQLTAAAMFVCIFCRKTISCSMEMRMKTLASFLNWICVFVHFINRNH